MTNVEDLSNMFNMKNDKPIAPSVEMTTEELIRNMEHNIKVNKETGDTK